MIRSKDEILKDLMGKQRVIDSEFRYMAENRDKLTVYRDDINELLLINMLIQIYTGYASNETQYYCTKLIENLGRFNYAIELAYNINFDYNIQVHLCYMLLEKCEYEPYVKQIVECENIQQQLRDEILAKATIKKLTS